MKRKKIVFLAIVAMAVVSGGIIYASDHIDAPSVTNQTTDITDLYVFQGANTNDLVFVGNTQGLLTPATTGAAKFDPKTLIQFNIDVNNDNIEDLVIQCIYDAASNTMKVYGPIKPTAPGLVSKLEGSVTASVGITPYGASAPIVTTKNGISVFAGPRDDPFFFDLDQYHAVLAGTASGFRNPGVDAFAGTNVMSVVVELPKSMIGGTGSVNVWLTTKKAM